MGHRSRRVWPRCWTRRGQARGCTISPPPKPPPPAERGSAAHPATRLLRQKKGRARAVTRPRNRECVEVTETRVESCPRRTPRGLGRKQPCQQEPSWSGDKTLGQESFYNLPSQSSGWHLKQVRSFNKHSSFVCQVLY